MDRIIYQRVVLKYNQQKAFQMFTVNEKLKWLTMLADVEPNVGGKYELFWNPKDKENDSTIGCKVLAVDPPKFLSFEWKGPKEFKHFMNTVRPLTTVSVSFIPADGDTEVHLLHAGWRDTPEWEQAREWFDRNWSVALKELENISKNE